MLTFATNDQAQPLVSVPLSGDVQSPYQPASPWPRWHHDNSNTGQSEEAPPAFDAGLLWVASLESPAATARPDCAHRPGGFYSNGPVVGSHGTVYQMACDGLFHAFNGDTGAPLWSVVLEPPTHFGFPMAEVGPNEVIALTFDTENEDKLYFTYSGYGPFSYELPALFQIDGLKQVLLASALTVPMVGYLAQIPPVGSSPVLALDGTLFTEIDWAFGASGTQVAPTVVVNPPSSLVSSPLSELPVQNLAGFDLWAQSLHTVAPAVDDDDSTIWCAAGNCLRLDSPANLEFELWATALGDGDFSRATGAPALGNGQVYVYAFSYTGGGSQYAGALQSLDPVSGKLNWQYALPSLPVPTPDPYASAWSLSMSPALSFDGTVVLQYVDGVYGIAGSGPQMGQLLWKAAGHGGTGSASLDANGLAYVGTFRDGLLVVDTRAKPSAPLRTFFPPSSGPPVSIGSTPAVTARGVYFTADDGNLYAIH